MRKRLFLNCKSMKCLNYKAVYSLLVIIYFLLPINKKLCFFKLYYSTKKNDCFFSYLI